MKILERTDRFIWVYKEPNMLSVPSRDPQDARKVLGLELQKELGIQIFPVHRLDFEVRGLMIFALQKESHRQLNMAFENHLVKKTYCARCEILPEARASASTWPLREMKTWTSKIVRGKKRSFFAEHGKDSVTQVSPLEWSVDQAVFELNPVTGRSHQLRLELSFHGYPILGDRLYGATLDFAQAGIALECCRIEFLDKDLVKKMKLPESYSLKSTI